MKKIKKILAMSLMLTCFSTVCLTGCTQENNDDTKLRIVSLSSDKTSYETGDKISLSVVANTLFEDCVLKTVDVTYQTPNNVDIAVKSCSATPNAENPKATEANVGYNYIIDGVFYKNDNPTQEFSITKYTYQYQGEIYAKTTNLKFSVSLKEKDYTTVELSVQDMSLVSYASNATNPTEIATPSIAAEGKSYSIADTFFDNKVIAVLLKNVSLDSNIDINTLTWLFEITNKNAEPKIVEVKNTSKPDAGNIILPLDGIVTELTEKIELVGATFGLKIVNSANIGKIFSKNLSSTTLLLTVNATEIKILDATVETDNYLISQTNEYFLDSANFSVKNSTVTLTCQARQSAVEISKIMFTHSAGNSAPQLIEVSAKESDNLVRIDNFPNSIMKMTFYVNYGYAGKHIISDFKIVGSLEGVEGTVELASSSKSITINVIDAFIENATDFVEKIAAKPSGYYAITKDFTLSVSNHICDTFTGTINGNGHRIALSTQTSAWFKELAKTACIKNLTFTTVSISLAGSGVNKESSALLCLTNKGLIENISIRNLELNSVVSKNNEFKGIVVTNDTDGVIRNIEFNVGTLKYFGTYEPNEITGICYQNNGLLYSIYGGYSSGTSWKSLSGKKANLITRTNNGKMADIICDFHLNIDNNNFNKVNLFSQSSGTNAQTSRLFYNSILIDDVESSSFVSTTNPANYRNISDDVKAGQLLFLNSTNPEVTELGVDWSENREYVLGFDSREVHNSDGTLTAIYHCVYSETIENVEYSLDAAHVFGKYYQDGDLHDSFTGTAYIFTGRINGGSKVKSTEMRNSDWLYSHNTSLGVQFDANLWNLLTLKHTADFTIKYV